MGIRTAIANAFRELRGNPLDNPVNFGNLSSFLATFGGNRTVSGEAINLRTALEEPTVNACRRVICDAIASLPIRFMERTADGHAEDPNHPLADLLQIAPNDEMSAYTFIDALVGSLVLTGNAYAEIQRDGGNRIVALWPIHPEQVKVIRNSDGTIIYQAKVGMSGNKTRTIQPVDMIHIPLFSFDGVVGLSPIALHRQTIGLSRAALKFGARFFGEGAHVGGVLSMTTDLDDDARAAYEESFARGFSGDNSHRTLFLYGADVKYNKIGITPEDSQFLQTRAFERAEIATIFGVSPHKVGDTTRLSNNSIENENLSFLTDTMTPYISRIVAEFNRKLLPTLGRNAGRHYIEFDLTQRKKGDSATIMKNLSVGRQWGVLTVDEGRKMLGLNPIGGDVGKMLITPVNMQDSARLDNTESIQDQPVQMTEQPLLNAPPKDPYAA